MKSTLNIINTANTSSSKANERADVMRRVHPSYVGYVDPTYSKDTGEGVGITKQMACTTSLSLATSSYLLKKILTADPAIMPLDKVFPEHISEQKLARVFVNGDFIGCCRSAFDVAYYYRQARRYGDIHHTTSIVCEILSREVKFWTDVGRMLRPLVIVYNNLAEYVEAWRTGKNTMTDGVRTETVKFSQWIKLTRAHLAKLAIGELTIENLREQRIIEYISPEEQETCYLALNIDILRENEHNSLQKFTHCEVEQAILGIITLASPMSNKSSAVRNTYYTNHRKQSSGWFALNYPYRIDKNTVFQYYCQRSLVNCITDRYTYPNGLNAIIALAQKGANQEDSAIVNSSSTDCGLFTVSYYTYEKTELGAGEQFGNLDTTKTLEVKRDANYEFLENGLVKKGTKANPGTVLVVKTAKNPKPDPKNPQFTMIDKSLVCKTGPVYVENVIKCRKEDDTQLVKVSLRSVRKLGIGDKMCYTPDHEVLTIRGWISIAEVAHTDLLATLEGANIVYRAPLNIFEYSINEPILKYSTSSVSLAVTMNHNMYVRSALRTQYEIIPAYKTIGKQWWFKKNGHNPATAKLTAKQISEYSARIIETLTAKQSAKHASAPAFPNFAQTAPASLQAIIERVVDHMGSNRFNARDIAQQLATMAFHADLSADFETLEKGEMLTIHMGKGSKTHEFFCAPDDMRAVIYEGKVYCVEVPSHIIYVRRNGLAVWCSQSSRHGNKGIISEERDRADMGYTADGLIPDIYVSQQSIPTRMAINQIAECGLSQLAAIKGCTFDGTVFLNIDPYETKEEMKKYGIKDDGKHRMFDGKTGDWVDTKIFIGPTTYQRLQKFVKDDGYAMHTGPLNAQTRQPVEGKSNYGGLRIGEMERDVITAQGGMRAFHEKYYIDSDGVELYVCRRCNTRAIVNEVSGLYLCNNCNDLADIVQVESSWSANLFMNELSAMGVKVLLKPEPHTYSRPETLDEKSDKK